MSEVAKVREALERFDRESVPKVSMDEGQDLAKAFVAHGLKVCKEYDEPIAGHEPSPQEPGQGGPQVMSDLANLIVDEVMSVAWRFFFAGFVVGGIVFAVLPWIWRHLSWQ